jgi:hypothetical protein
MADEIFDAGNPEQVKERKSKAKRLAERRKNDLRMVLESTEGKRFVWAVMSECGIHSDPFHQNALVMARTVGRQSIGHFLTVLIAEACPEKYLEMQLLAAKEEANG